MNKEDEEDKEEEDDEDSRSIKLVELYFKRENVHCQIVINRSHL